MKTVAMAAIAVAMFTATQAPAQMDIHWPAPASAGQVHRTVYFPSGTPLMLATRTQLSTKDNKPGDRLYLDVMEPLTYQDQVVVPAGALAVGEVTEVQRNGHFGVKGKLGIRLLQVQTPFGPVRISGNARDEGTSGTALSVGTILLVSPLGFLIHGTSATLAAGTPVSAYLAEDLRFAPSALTHQAVATAIDPDGLAETAPKVLPAHFDPSVFGHNGARIAKR